MRYTMILGSVGVAFGNSAYAAELNINVEVPRINVAEYHRPYVAIWIERADQTIASNLAVWYDVRLRNNQGTRWLKDMRHWWRRGGRDTSMPVDGVSSATRPAGQHSLSFSDNSPLLAKLPAGEYKLQVEAAREAGSHETVSLPFQWPPKKAQQSKNQGSSELSNIMLELKP